MSFHPNTSFYERESLIQSINRTGLSINLQLALDAGDVNSYSGTQSWSDTSSNAASFFRGTTSGVDTRDPTFNGTIGQRTVNEYFSFDGADLFTYSTANATWMQTLHKEGALFTVAAWIRPASNTVSSGLFGTNSNTSTTAGVVLQLASTGLLQLAVARSTSGSFAKNISGSSYTANEWQMVAWSVNENGSSTGSFFWRNGTASTFNGSYSSPTTNNASFTAQIGALGNNTTPVANGTRIGMFAAWSGTQLTSQQLTNLYTLTRKRYGV